MSSSRWTAAGVLVLAALCWSVAVQARAQQRLEHLLKAAEHLDQAGLADQAAEIRTLANEELRIHGGTLLEQRLRQLATLQKEIDLLRQATATLRQVKVSLRVFELQAAKLEGSGLALVSLRPLLENPTPNGLVDEDGKLAQFIDFLQKQGLVNRLAAPTLTVLDGQTAQVSVGEPAAPSKGRPEVATPPDVCCGLHFHCRPAVLDGGKLSLDFGLRQSEKSASDSVRAPDGPSPALRTGCELKSRVQLRSGQTLLIGGPRNQRGDASSGLLLLLTAEIVPAEKESGTTP